VRGHLSALAFEPERVVLSFHGIPERLVRAGDPYKDEVETSAKLLRAAMGWNEAFAPLCYQSRFGPEKWLGPATADKVEAFAKAGVKSIAVIAPGFVCDCLETLEELGVELRERFLQAGGENFAVLPCLNDGDEAVAMLTALARQL
jgi:ferrochelatase